MQKSTRGQLIGAVVVLFIASMFVQTMLDPMIREIHKGEKTALQGLSNEFILGPMLGLQQAVAGALWVRADEFFHEGDYDAILPIVRMVTWLDPHQLDVYITGAWHLAYNFTDSSERSDRRYIPAAQKLLEEGDANNQEVYDIAFELGWQNTDKIKNYDRAEEWFRKATTRNAANSTGEAVDPAPLFVWHQLAHALERQGRLDDSFDIWRQCLVKSTEKLKKTPNDFSIRSVHDSELHNLELNLKRKYSRYVHEIDFTVDAKRTQSVNMQTGEPTPNDSYLSTNEKRDKVPVGSPRKPSTAVPFDTAFDTVVAGKMGIVFTRPKILELKGQFLVGDGARVTIRMHDDNYKDQQLKDFKFEVDQSQTIMVDQHSVRKAMWGRKIDMSKDPKMYSFEREHYFLVFEYNPRSTSPFLQDKFGWSGEGMTDQKYIWTEKANTPKKSDIRMIRKVYKISKDQIMAARPITEADVFPNDQYDKIYKENSAPTDAAQ